MVGERVRDCLIWNYSDDEPRARSPLEMGRDGGSPSAEDGLRYSRHLHEEAEGLQRGGTWTVSGNSGGYCHNCVCGGGHGGSATITQSYSGPVTEQWTSSSSTFHNQTPAVHTHEPPPSDHVVKMEQPPPPPSGRQSKSKGAKVKWNKSSMLRNLHRAEILEDRAKHKMWAKNRFDKTGPRLDTFGAGTKVPKRMLKHPHVLDHGYCPVHPESTCICQDCGNGSATCTCDDPGSHHGWHNEGFENRHMDRLPHSARTASEQRNQPGSKSRRPYVPRADRDAAPPIRTTFAGSRTRGPAKAKSGPGYAYFEA